MNIVNPWEVAPLRVSQITKVNGHVFCHTFPVGSQAWAVNAFFTCLLSDEFDNVVVTNGNGEVLLRGE